MLLCPVKHLIMNAFKYAIIFKLSLLLYSLFLYLSLFWPTVNSWKSHLQVFIVIAFIIMLQLIKSIQHLRKYFIKGRMNIKYFAFFQHFNPPLTVKQFFFFFFLLKENLIWKIKILKRTVGKLKLYNKEKKYNSNF